ncbi:MAG: diguanylate cyclase [Lachnospiraceae bacterium]|nr:diguanylate cyclase [Lachnospiraceae bacterium]
MNLQKSNSNNRRSRLFADESAKFTFVCYSFAVVHIIYFGFFLSLDTLLLYAYAMFSSLLYLYMGFVTVRKKQFIKMLLITVVEVAFFAVLCTVCLGWKYGFMLYLVAMIPIIFYLFTSVSNARNTQMYSNLLTIFVILCFILTKWFGDFEQTLYTPKISDTLIRTVYCINCLLAFAMQTIFSFIYTMEIQHFKSNLESEKDILDAIASKDPLTGLLNRRAMEPHLTQAKETAEQKGSLFSLILCDIDDFKKVNDVHGHALGDQVLKDIAGTFRDNLRDSDYACRWGGEEFLLLIPGRMDIASSVAERLRTQVSTLSFKSDVGTFSVTMTFGVTEYETGYRLEKLIKIADDNLYKGKENGKNQVVCS